MGQGLGGKRESPRLGSNIYTEILPKLINWAISQSQSDSLAKGSKYCTSSLSGCAILHPIREQSLCFTERKVIEHKVTRQCLCQCNFYTIVNKLRIHTIVSEAFLIYNNRQVEVTVVHRKGMVVGQYVCFETVFSKT